MFVFRVIFFLHSCSVVFFLSEGERCFVFVIVWFCFVLFCFSRTQWHPLVCMCVPVRLWTLVWPRCTKALTFFCPIITTHTHEGCCHGNLVDLSTVKEKGRRGEENRDKERRKRDRLGGAWIGRYTQCRIPPLCNSATHVMNWFDRFCFAITEEETGGGGGEGRCTMTVLFVVVMWTLAPTSLGFLYFVLFYYLWGFWCRTIDFECTHPPRVKPD